MINTDTNTYDFSIKVLKKWVANRLTVEENSSDLKARFDIVGSTCSNMGWPIIFSLHMNIEKISASYSIQKAYLQFSEDPGHKKMCYFQTDNSSNKFLETAPFKLGYSLKNTILELKQHPPAGCLCTQKSRKYFWNIAVQTTWYYLNNTNIKTK